MSIDNVPYGAHFMYHTSCTTWNATWNIWHVKYQRFTLLQHEKQHENTPTWNLTWNPRCYMKYEMLDEIWNATCNARYEMQTKRYISDIFFYYGIEIWKP